MNKIIAAQQWKLDKEPGNPRDSYDINMTLSVIGTDSLTVSVLMD